MGQVPLGQVDGGIFLIVVDHAMDLGYCLIVLSVLFILTVHLFFGFNKTSLRVVLMSHDFRQAVPALLFT